MYGDEECLELRLEIASRPKFEKGFTIQFGSLNMAMHNLAFTRPTSISQVLGFS